MLMSSSLSKSRRRTHEIPAPVNFEMKFFRSRGTAPIAFHMIWKKYRLATWLAPLVCLLAGCATSEVYDTSEGSELGSAIIHGASSGNVLFSPTPVIIRAVDGEPVPGTSSSVKVSPGQHILRVTCYESPFSKNTHDLTVAVYAGETYTLHSEIRPSKIKDDTPDCQARLNRDESR